MLGAGKASGESSRQLHHMSAILIIVRWQELIELISSILTHGINNQPIDYLNWILEYINDVRMCCDFSWKCAGTVVYCCF